jgi:hypothetical protein
MNPATINAIPLPTPTQNRPFPNRRLAREWKTVAAMLQIYCEDHHAGHDRLCPECQSLSGYVNLRLDRCRFGADKPTCANCPVHCYQKNRREQIKAVMRYAGPKMMFRHPWLSLCHLLDGWFRKATWRAPANAEPDTPSPSCTVPADR